MVDVTCSISYNPEVHSVYVPVKSLGSFSGSASTALSFILLPSATVGSAYTSMQVNVHRSAHPHRQQQKMHTYTNRQQPGGLFQKQKMHTYTNTHIHR